MCLVVLRLPPGQALLAGGVEVWLSRQLAADVQIGRLCTNLWDEVRLQDVALHFASGPTQAVRVRGCRIVMKSGPPTGMASPQCGSTALTGFVARAMLAEHVLPRL